MSTHACTEDQLVEQPAIGLFAKLGRTTVSALKETFGAVQSHAAARPITAAVDELTRDRSAMSRFWEQMNLKVH